MKQQKIIIFSTIIIGIIVPFVPYLTIIQMFFLLIPFVIIFAVSLIYLLRNLLTKKANTHKTLFVFSILPIFIISQLLSGFTVDKIQKLRSNRIIYEIEKIKSETGNLPEKYELFGGIKYTKNKEEESYVIEYTRGFMVIEKYQSKYKHWRSYGWND